MTAATAHPRIGSVVPDAFASAARRIMGRCDDLARISAGEGRITRVYLSPEHARVNQVVAAWMREVGMTARTDAAGNLTGVLPAADPDAPVVMLGSHLDTVTDAGRYDGILGVLLGIEVVRLLRERAADGGWQSPFPFGLEVAAFSDEEGTRFGKALLGSSAVAGAWEDGWWDLTDADGTPYDMRRDALLGASEAALAVERICSSEHHIIGTVGRLEAFPGAVNVVPGEARFSIDLRGEFDGARDATWARISAELDAIMGRRRLRWAAREVHAAPALFCDPLLQDVVRAGIGATDPGAEPATLFSPAGHDGMMIGSIAPVGMLFLRNPDGISHHPDEAVGTADVAVGLRAFAEAVALLGEERLP